MTNNVQDVTLFEVQPGFFARNIRILGGDVRKVCSHTDLSDIVYIYCHFYRIVIVIVIRLYLALSDSTLAVRGYYFKSDCPF